MTTIDDIANWVINDVLKRNNPLDTDVQSVARNAALYFYKALCAKVPFDELQTTSVLFNTASGQATYTLGTDWQFIPVLRAIQNIQIVLNSTNKRRLRRSHIRVYDALSLSPPSQPSTYARWDTTLTLNPPPDSSSYQLMFRYWYRPVIGQLYNITNATFANPTATYTIGNHLLQNGDIVDVVYVSPSSYNVNKQAITATTSTTVSLSIPNAALVNPSAYTLGGQLFCQQPALTPWYQQPFVTPEEWDELIRWETLYRVYIALDQIDKAQALVTPQGLPRQQGSPKKIRVFETGIIPRLWNDLLETVSQKENVDEDFSINPVIRPYSLSI